MVVVSEAVHYMTRNRSRAVVLGGLGVRDASWWQGGVGNFATQGTFSNVCRCFSCHNFWGRMLLASSGSRPGMLLNILLYTE